ncbi:hypothetical protein HYS92_01750 [Candidatus Daviesbacteria bacterium]|nr:hypothetical protein [Candidatus Daviesbacteria bacterium]
MSRILFRARLVFSILLGLFLVFILAGIYQGVQSGDFDKVFVAPFRQFSQDLQTALEPTPSPSPSLSPSSPPTPKPTQKPVTQPVVKPTQPQVANCIRKNIREGEFASNKCYSQTDYEDLEYYLQRFNYAVFSLDGAEASMRITCSGSDFFKDSCERDKKEKSQAESDISKYRGIIQGIIAKGK